MAVKLHISTTFHCNCHSHWAVCFIMPSGYPHTWSKSLGSTPVASDALEFLHLSEGSYQKCVGVKSQANRNDKHNAIDIGMFVNWRMKHVAVNNCVTFFFRPPL